MSADRLKSQAPLAPHDLHSEVEMVDTSSQLDVYRIAVLGAKRQTSLGFEGFAQRSKGCRASERLPAP
ncbi:MAG: hypothetical protein GY926_19010 [bacterium]|nr:hypothetical protein [bacterium]